MRKKLQPHQKDLLGFLLAGLLLMLLPYLYYQPGYDELDEKEIVVRDVGYVVQRGSPSYYLTTANGERMEIRGDLSYQELSEALVPNTRVTVKYYRGLCYFWMTDYIKELTHNGRQLVAYSGDQQKENQTVLLIIGLLVILTGLLFYDFRSKSIRKYLKKKAQRQEKLKKKYGDRYREPKENTKN